METYIEFINAYIFGKLSGKERQNFETRLQSEPEFEAIYQEHLIMLHGIQRVQLKSEIQNAKNSYVTTKWIRIIGVSTLIISVLIALGIWLFDKAEIPPSPIEYENTSISDSNLSENTQSKINSDTLQLQKTVISLEDSILLNSTMKKTITETPPINSSIEKPSQVFKLNSEKDLSISCEEGTIIKLSKDSFLNPQTGQVVHGEIELKVTEYYGLSDILLANLSTASGDKQLETGGMIYLEATQGEVKLDLMKNASIEIHFPTEDKKLGMQLFSGKWSEGNIDWTLQNNQTSVSEEVVEVPFITVEQVPTFPGCEDGDNDARKKCFSDAVSSFVSRNFNLDVAYGLNGSHRILCNFKIDQNGNVLFVQTRSEYTRLSDEAQRVIKMLPKFQPGRQRGKAVIVPYSFPLTIAIQDEQMQPQQDSIMDSSQSILNIPSGREVEFDTVYTVSRGQVELIREVLHDKDFPVDSIFLQEWQGFEKQKLIRKLGGLNNRRYLLRKPLFEMENTKFKILEDDSITRGGHIIRIPWDESEIPTTSTIMKLVPKERFSAGSETVSKEKFEERLSDVADATISSRDAGYYILKTSSLGWINCDRFINGRTKRIKYKLKISSSEDANVSMVFKSYNSVLPSYFTNGYYDFQTVGENEPVVLVFIQRKNGKLYYDAVETTTESNPNVEFEIREISIEELKNELKLINGEVD